MLLSEHFSLSELTVTNTGLPNTPTTSQIQNLKRLAETLEEVRALFNLPLVVTSGFRSEAVNKKVGGSKTSAHAYGCAADFTVKGKSVREVCEAIKKSGIKFDQLIDEGTWIHLSVDSRYRQQILSYRGGKYLSGLV